MERLGTISHFFEAFFSVGVSIVAVYLLATLIRISRLHRCSFHAAQRRRINSKFHRVQLGAMTISEMRLKQRAEQALMYLGVVILASGVIVFALTVNQGAI